MEYAIEYAIVWPFYRGYAMSPEPRGESRSEQISSRAVRRWRHLFRSVNRLEPALVFTSIAFLAAIVFWYPSVDSSFLHDQVRPYDDGWFRVAADGTREALETLPAKRAIPRGETLRLHNVLPDSLPPDTVLCLRSSRQEVRVLLEGEEIARYGDNLPYPFTNLPPSAFALVQIPPDAAGKRIEVRLASPFSPDSGRISRIVLGSMAACLAYTNSIYRTPLVLLLSFAIFGLMLIFAGHVAGKRNRQHGAVKHLGLLMLLFALWRIAAANMLQPYIGNYYSVPTLAFLIFLLLPLPYLRLIRSSLDSRRFPLVIDAMQAVFVLNFFIQAGVHLAGIAHFSGYYWVNFLLFGLCILGGIVLTLLSITDDERYTLIPMFLLSLLLAVTYIVEVFTYYERLAGYENFGTAIFGGVAVYSLGMLFYTIYRASLELEQTGHMREELANQQISIALSQIRPHFLYNSLASIHTLISSDPERASAMVYNFSRYLRANLSNIGSNEMIPFSDEMRNIEAYTGIEQVRFPRITIRFELAAADFHVPVLTIQPLVENAIRHGLSKKAGGGTLVVRSFEDGEAVYVEVCDDGVGFGSAGLKGQAGVGLRNVAYRLKTLAGAGLDIRSAEGQGTRVLVTFPKRLKEG
jgi:sensor histidine kinase YesM